MGVSDAVLCRTNKVDSKNIHPFFNEYIIIFPSRLPHKIQLYERMFQLDDEEQKRFYEEQRNGLDEERRSLLETYERSLFKARHVELQVLEWENARHKEALAQHFGSSTDDPSTKAHDLHAKCRETQQFLTDLVTHQNALDEQIEALMTLKQPVQHETTYLFKNPVNKARSYNITVASTPSQPKLTFEQFCQRLFTPAQDAVRVEHTLKREVTQMAEGLLSLQRSVKAAVETIDRAEEAAQTKSKTARIQSLVQRIHKMDRLAFMTVLEHINLKKRLLAVEKSRTAEVAEMYQQCELIDERKRYLQVCIFTLYLYVEAFMYESVHIAFSNSPLQMLKILISISGYCCCRRH